MNEEDIQRVVNSTLQAQASLDAQNNAMPPADVQKLEAEAQQVKEFQDLQHDYMLVVCDYVPKIFYLNLLMIGALVFALLYKILKQHFSNFV